MITVFLFYVFSFIITDADIRYEDLWDVDFDDSKNSQGWGFISGQSSNSLNSPDLEISLDYDPILRLNEETDMSGVLSNENAESALITPDASERQSSGDYEPISKASVERINITEESIDIDPDGIFAKTSDNNTQSDFGETDLNIRLHEQSNKIEKNPENKNIAENDKDFEKIENEEGTEIVESDKDFERFDNEEKFENVEFSEDEGLLENMDKNEENMEEVKNSKNVDFENSDVLKIRNFTIDDFLNDEDIDNLQKMFKNTFDNVEDGEKSEINMTESVEKNKTEEGYEDNEDTNEIERAKFKDELNNLFSRIDLDWLQGLDNLHKENVERKDKIEKDKNLEKNKPTDSFENSENFDSAETFENIENNDQVGDAELFEQVENSEDSDNGNIENAGDDAFENNEVFESSEEEFYSEFIELRENESEAPNKNSLNLSEVEQINGTEPSSEKTGQINITQNSTETETSTNSENSTNPSDEKTEKEEPNLNSISNFLSLISGSFNDDRTVDSESMNVAFNAAKYLAMSGRNGTGINSGISELEMVLGEDVDSAQLNKEVFQKNVAQAYENLLKKAHKGLQKVSFFPKHDVKTDRISSIDKSIKIYATYNYYDSKKKNEE